MCSASFSLGETSAHRLLRFVHFSREREPLILRIGAIPFLPFPLATAPARLMFDRQGIDIHGLIITRE